MTAAKKPLTRAQKAAEKAWAGLTTRQKKGLDPKKYEREVKAAAKQKEADKKAAEKLKAANKKAADKAKKEKLAAAAKAKAAALKAKKAPAKKAAKVAKKSTISKAKEAVKKVASRTKTVISETLAPGFVPAAAEPKKGKAAAATPSGLAAQPRITEARMVNGLHSHSTYVIVAEKPKGNTDFQIGVRYCGSEYRIHAFPDFAAHGIDAPMYANGTRRSAQNNRGAYQTKWVGKEEFKGFMAKLRESALHAHIIDELLQSKLSLSSVEPVAATA